MGCFHEGLAIILIIINLTSKILYEIKVIKIENLKQL